MSTIRSVSPKTHPHYFTYDQNVGGLLHPHGQNQRAVQKALNKSGGPKGDDIDYSPFKVNDSRNYQFLKPEFARMVPHETAIRAKHDAFRRLEHATYMHKSEVEHAESLTNKLLSDYTNADGPELSAEQIAAIRNPETTTHAVLHAVLEQHPNKANITTQAQFNELIASKNKILHLSAQCDEYGQAVADLQRLGWATRGGFKSFFAPMFGKNSREIVTITAILIATAIPYFGLPPLYDMYKRHQQTNAHPALC